MFGLKTKIKRCIAHCIASNFKSSKNKLIEQLPFNRKLKLYIPTYDKKNQIVHPDILIRENSPKYILTFTPYTNTNDKIENPSIAISEDGIHFKEEIEGINPLVSAPEQDHNDDPDISYKEGLYSIVYLETVRPNYQNLMLLTSTDRIKWYKEILHHEDLQNDRETFMLSPSVIYKNSECFLFAVNKSLKKGNSLYSVKGDSLKNIDFSTNVKLNLNSISDKHQPWHVDIFKDEEDGYIMLLCMVSLYSCKKKEHVLFIGRSTNLTDWDFEKTPVIKNCYRSTGFVKDGVLYIYFSSNIYADVWKTGLYKTYFR